MKCISGKEYRFLRKPGLHLCAVLQQPTEQMVLSLLAFDMILQDSVLEAEKVGKICRNQSPGGEIWSTWGRRTWLDTQTGVCQHFPLPAVWNRATLGVFSKAGMKRNPLGTTDISVGFRGAVTAVHITWHQCLSRPLRHVEHISADVWRNSFLELWFGVVQIRFSTRISKS